MKSSLKLFSHCFEKIEVSFPSFPSRGGALKIKGARGSVKIYHSSRRENVSALKWELRIASVGTRTKKPDFIFNVIIIGEFDHGLGLPHAKKDRLLRKEGIPILFDILSSAIAKIMNHSTLKGNPLSAVRIKDVKYSSKHRH